MRPYKRRQYITDAEFQGRIITQFAVIMLGAMTVSILALNYFSRNVLESLKWGMVIYAHTLGDLLLPYLIYISIGAFIFTAVVLVLLSRRLYRRVAGTMTRLRNDIKDVAAGDLLKRIALGDDDPFASTADELDMMVCALRDRFRGAEANIQMLKRHVDFLVDAREEMLPIKCEQIMHEIEKLESSLTEKGHGSNH